MGKKYWLVAAAALAAGVMLIGQFLGSTVQTGAWGLSFSGGVPQGPESSRTLGQYDAFYMGDPEEKVLYLTFDAGYENGCTAQILDVLQKHQVPAAFFLVGNYIEKNADLVRRMTEEGHIVGNHTMHHKDMSKITDPEVFAGELTALEELFRETTGQTLPKFYRPPQGLYSAQNLEQAQKMGYRTVFWSLAYADWGNSAQPGKAQAFDKLLGRTHNGAVILLHSTSKTNAAILDELLTEWKSRGYTFAPLTEMTP